MSCFRLLGVIALLLSFSLPPVWAQSGADPWGQRAPARGSVTPESPAGQDSQIQRDLQLQRQKKRYEEMKRDSQKLLQIATELKQYVDRSGENILSVDVLRKAEEMEKLSRQIKNNMRGE
jgi:hypothetical protein